MSDSISRRHLLILLGSSVAMLSAGALLSACGGDNDDEGKGDPTFTTDSGIEPTAIATDVSPTPTAGGASTTEPTSPSDSDSGERPVLKIAVQELPATLDPYQELTNVGTRVTYSIFDHLLERDFIDGDPPGTGSGILPMLAGSWERIDELTMTFTLRDEVTFHNGDPLTAEDVKFTFERLIVDPPEELIEAAGYVSTIGSVEVLDEYTVQFNTPFPDPLLEIRLTSWATWILPKNYYQEVGVEGFAFAPVGTGPYKFVEMRADELLVLEAYDAWWGGQPPVARVEFRVIPEIAGRVASLSSGESDIITNIPPDQVSAIQSIAEADVLSVPLANCHVIRYNMNFAPLSDKLLRKAMNLAIDRELLVEALWSGQAEVMRSLQFPEYAGPIGGDQFNPDRPFTPFDAAQATELVEQSSYNGEEIVFRSAPAYYTNGANAAEAIVQMWQDVGINAKVELLQNPYQDGVDAIQVVNWSNSSFVADPDGAFWLRWGEDSGTQPVFWTPENPRFNVLGKQARETLDTVARYDAYQEMLDIWEDEAPGTDLYIPIEHYGVRSNVQWIPYSFYYMDFRPDALQFE